MAPPPVSIYVTSLTSQPKVRQNIELLRRSLRALEIPYTEHDLVMEEDAKKLWQRAKPAGQVIGLPGYLVGGEWVGTMDDFEYAAETSTLPSFLKQDTDLAADQSVGEAELERLMREMSDADLDALAAEVDKSSESKAETSTKSPLPAALAKGEPGGVGSAQDAVKGISSAAASTVESITQKATELVKSLGGEEGQFSVGSITQKAEGIVRSLGGAEAHSGTKDERKSPSPSGAAFPSNTYTGEVSTSDPTGPVSAAKAEAAKPTTTVATGGKGDESAVDSPSSASPVEGGDSASRTRRLSKQEIAEKMANANSVEGLLESLDMAEGKEKVKVD